MVFYPNGIEALFHAINVRGVGPDEAAAMMCANYARMPFEHAAELRDVMHHLIATDTAPHLIHCTSGKDRTGILVAFLLLALDVPRDGGVRGLPAEQRRLATDGHVRHQRAQDTIAAVMAAPAEFLESALDAIEARCGSFAGYMDTWLGFGDRERAALARLMLS